MGNLCSLERVFSTKFKNLLPTFVEILLLSDRLNQIVFRFLCNLLVWFSILSTFVPIYFSDVWYPDFFNASSFSGFTESKICLLEELLEGNSLNDVGNLFRNSGGWFDYICIWLGVLLGFLYGRYVFFLKSNVASRKSISGRLVIISILCILYIYVWIGSLSVFLESTLFLYIYIHLHTYIFKLNIIWFFV